MGANRDRFERELLSLRGYRFKRLLVVGTREDIAAGHYHSKIAPKAVLATLGAFEIRYDSGRHVPTPEAGAREIERWTWNFARKSWRTPTARASAAEVRRRPEALHHNDMRWKTAMQRPVQGRAVRLPYCRFVCQFLCFQIRFREGSGKRLTSAWLSSIVLPHMPVTVTKIQEVAGDSLAANQRKFESLSGSEEPPLVDSILDIGSEQTAFYKLAVLRPKMRKRRPR